MFKKLNKDFNVGEYTIGKRKIGFGTEVAGKFQGIEYYYVDFEQQDLLMNVIPVLYQKDFCLLLMRANCPIPPHTDSGILTTVNFYIRTDQCDTEFYGIKNTQPTLSQVSGQTDGHVFDPQDLYITGSFTALPGQAWVLDVSQPHSVLPQQEFTERLAFSLSTSDHSYQDVCNLLKETGNL